jgi:hypothetical protein
MWFSVLSLFISSVTALSLPSLNVTRVDTVGSYDWGFCEISLWHSEATYCDPDSFVTRTYKGVLAGFVPVYRITEKSHGNFFLSPLIQKSLNFLP